MDPRPFLPLVLTCACTPADPVPAPASDPTPRIEADWGWYPAKVTAADAREIDRIDAELDELFASGSHDWAGDYSYGDGLGVNVHLRIGPESFTFTWYGCLGMYDANHGRVFVGERDVVLRPELENLREGFQGIDTTFVPVAWGERRYLITPAELEAFLDGGEARTRPHGMHLLRDGDEELPAPGRPTVLAARAQGDRR